MTKIHRTADLRVGISSGRLKRGEGVVEDVRGISRHSPQTIVTEVNHVVRVVG